MTNRLSDALTAHRAAIALDSRRYMTCARNELLELRMNKRTQTYVVHTAHMSYIVCADVAAAIYAACVRHTVRLAKRLAVRASVYALRSDIRSIIRAQDAAQFAH